MLKIMIITALLLPAVATAASEKSKNRERLVCKRDIVIGSNVRPKRTCLTPKEWQLAEELNRKNVETWQMKIDGARRAN